VAINTRLFDVPLDEVLVDAKHGKHTHFQLITCTVRTEDGLEGTGYSYTGGRGGTAVAAMLRDDLGPWIVGRAAGPEALHDAMGWHMHYVGRGGVLSFALSAIDIALWDLRGRREGRSLARMAGGHAPDCGAYFGGIDLGFELPRLLDSIEGYLERQAGGVKIKVGRGDDLARVRAVRDLIGLDMALMVDANYSMEVEGAIRAAFGFMEHGIRWFEEPVDPDDLDGYARIATTTGCPLAMGENFHTGPDFANAVARARLSFLQPDASNCGGVTGWLRAAAMARAAGMPVSSHGMPELHVSLVASQPHGDMIEMHSFPIDRYTERPVILRDGRATAPDVPGIGVSFDWGRLTPFERR
jgi:L-alanine-DL-glutamate epimerase-like enolase superfamily enzyme